MSNDIAPHQAHRSRVAYLDIFVVAVLVPLAALAVVVGLGTAFGSF